MSGMENIEFPDLTASELETYARQKAADIGLSIPDAYVTAVLENLAALQTHAAILAAALQAAEAQASGSPAS